MKEEIKNAVQNYQCSGCTLGPAMTCFNKSVTGGVGCAKHYAGTTVMGIGKIFLGLPKGFNRLGPHTDLSPNIFETFESSEWKYTGIFNIPVWKHLTKDGHTLVRGIMPRRNESFLHIFLENCLDKINCLEITEQDIEKMD